MNSRFITDPSHWLPPVPCHKDSAGNAPESALPAPLLPPMPAGCLAQLPGGAAALRLRTRSNESLGETSASMTAAALLTLIKRADQTISYEQLRTWVVAQAVRNALQTFHDCPAFDPDDPDSGAGFISDGQMRALNITIRRAVHEALGQVDIARNVATQPHGRKLHARQQEALDFCEFQLGTVHSYMEPPGSPELEEAYQRHVSEPDVNRGCWPEASAGS